MADRLNSKLYSQALQELRNNHLAEFEAIRKRLYDEFGLSYRNSSLPKDQILYWIETHDGEFSMSEIAHGTELSNESVRVYAQELAKERMINVRYEGGHGRYPKLWFSRIQ